MTNTTTTPATLLADVQIAGTSMRWMLSEIGGWHVESIETVSNTDAIFYAGDKGLIEIRMHYAEKYPEGVKAYELTDKGILVLERLAGEDVAAEAHRKRQFYRDNTRLLNWNVTPTVRSNERTHMKKPS